MLLSYYYYYYAYYYVKKSNNKFSSHKFSKNYCKICKHERSTGRSKIHSLELSNRKIKKIKIQSKQFFHNCQVLEFYTVTSEYIYHETGEGSSKGKLGQTLYFFRFNQNLLSVDPSRFI